MKNKISKILGVVLVLTVLAGLLIVATPVSAANMAWSIVGTPGVNSANVLVSPTSTVPAPTVPASYLMAGAADGKSFFAYDNTNKIYYRSTDGGSTWVTGVNYLPSGITAGVMTAIAVSYDYANDKTVVLTSATGVYASSNGGATFGTALADVTASIVGGTITSAAAGPYYTGAGTSIIVGVKGATAATGGALYMTPGGFGGAWNVVDFSTVGKVDVYAVAFSPNHRSDALFLFVTANGTSAYIDTKFGTNPVDNEYGRVPVESITTPTLNTGNINSAAITFPADFGTGANVFFVGFNAPLATGSDTYRVSLSYKASGGGITSSCARLGALTAGSSSNILSLDFKGNLSDGKLYVSDVNGLVKYATATTASSVSFVMAAGAPFGVNTVVFTSPSATDTNVFAMTTGTGSAFYVSSDAALYFQQASLIWVSSSAVTLNDLDVIDANTIYVIMKDGITTTLFKTTNGGAAWLGVLVETSTTGDMANIWISPTYATDNTVYVTQSDNLIRKTTNAGLSFLAISAPSSPSGQTSSIYSFALVDGSNYFVGTDNGLFKSGSYSAALGTSGTITSIAYIDATNMYVGSNSGAIYFSSNGGASFTTFLPPVATSGSIIIKADVGFATNKYLYASTGSNLYRFQVGASLAWSSLSAIANVSSITQGTDGTMYVSANATYRCVTPTAPGPQTVETVSPVLGAAPATTAVKSINALATGTAQVPNNTLYAIYGSSVYTLQDTLVSPPVTTSPAANSQISTNDNFTWTAPAGAPVGIKYEVQISLDATFTNVVNTSVANTATTGQSGTLYSPITNSGNLQAGQSYYWRVRVGAGYYLASRWSAGVPFSVKLAQAGNDLSGTGGIRLQPAAGATDVSTKPVFSWAAVNGALSYDLQVADNPVFVNPLDAQTGLNTTVWTYTKTLDNSKTYYWRVRAVAASGTASDWVASAFTTEAKGGAGTGATSVATPVTSIVTSILPAVTPTVTVNIPSQAAPIVTVTIPPASSTASTTPASIWVLIAIGAVLIIAVIVLIARTRRV